jgi:hypothetical protein
MPKAAVIALALTIATKSVAGADVNESAFASDTTDVGGCCYFQHAMIIATEFVAGSSLWVCNHQVQDWATDFLHSPYFVVFECDDLADFNFPVRERVWTVAATSGMSWRMSPNSQLMPFSW